MIVSRRTCPEAEQQTMHEKSDMISWCLLSWTGMFAAFKEQLTFPDNAFRSIPDSPALKICSGLFKYQLILILLSKVWKPCPWLLDYSTWIYLAGSRLSGFRKDISCLFLKHCHQFQLGQFVGWNIDGRLLFLTIAHDVKALIRVTVSGWLHFFAINIQ